jgi:hypothetical protein
MLILIVLEMKCRRNADFEMDSTLTLTLNVLTFEEIFIH